jgi:hypothetical protein
MKLCFIILVECTFRSANSAVNAPPIQFQIGVDWLDLYYDITVQVGLALAIILGGMGRSATYFDCTAVTLWRDCSVEHFLFVA